MKEKASKSVLERHKSPEQSRLLLQLLFILLRTETSCLDLPFTIHQFVSPVVVVISPECLTSNFAHPDGWRFALKGQGFIITVKPRTRNLPSSLIARVRFYIINNRTHRIYWKDNRRRKRAMGCQIRRSDLNSLQVQEKTTRVL